MEPLAWVALVTGLGVAMSAIVVARTPAPAPRCPHRWDEVGRDARRLTLWSGGAVGVGNVLSSHVITYVLLRCKRCGDVIVREVGGDFRRRHW